MKLLKPVKGKIIQLYGEPSQESLRMGYAGHTGIDFQARKGFVRAAHDGRVVIEEGVVYVKKDGETLNGVPVNIETAYVHLTKITPGLTWVNKGDVIGHVGSEKGLHFSLTVFWKKNGLFQPFEKNGYNGRIDPLPYFSDQMVYFAAIAVFFIAFFSIALVEVVGEVKKHYVIDETLPTHSTYDP